jgi:Mn2+/Fe2+ NRAMP family transporter
MHGSGASFESNPVQFAAQVIGLYEQALGKWSGYAVGIASLAVMFSTYLTILDGFPRALANVCLMLKGKEEAADEDDTTDKERHRFYWMTMVVMVGGALAILSFFIGNLSQLVDFAATISFLAAPIFAFLNHRAIMGSEIPDEVKPGAGLRAWSICGITALVGFAF